MQKPAFAAIPFNLAQFTAMTWLSAWFLLVLVLLVLFVLYLRGAFHRKVTYRLKNIPRLDDPHFTLAMMGVSASLLTSGFPTGFWFEVDKIYAGRLESIRRARRTIHFETFFMTPGRRAREFAEALIERALAGVEVLLIVDTTGANSMPKKYWKQLRSAGVKVRFFHPFNWMSPLTYNIRTHRKLLLIDGETAFVGGMGVSDDWDGVKENGDTDCWLDFEVCFQGPIVGILEGIFMQQWLYVGGVASLKKNIFNPATYGGVPVVVTPKNSPSPGSSVYALFYTSVLAAKKRIWLASPYFLPDAQSRRALLKAKRNGVDVRILTVGPHNDKTIVYYAVRERYEEFLSAGIEIYEYQPSMMHAKVLLLDDHWVSTGSANFDPRSLFHNQELHLSLSEPKLVKFVESFFVEAFSKSQRIHKADWKARPVRERWLGQVALFFRWQL